MSRLESGATASAEKRLFQPKSVSQNQKRTTIPTSDQKDMLVYEQCFRTPMLPINENGIQKLRSNYAKEYK